VQASLSQELVQYVASKPPLKVKTVFISQGFTGVKLATGELGLALTPLTRFDTCIGATRLAGSLSTYNSAELARFSSPRQSAHLRSIGLAAVNAVLQRELRNRSDFLEGDFLEFLSMKSTDVVATIDYYTTKIEFLKSTHLMIFDDRFAGKRKDIAIFPLSDIKDKFGQADVVIIPPTFIDRIDELRHYAVSAREFAVVHPTTPPLPELFFKHGVTMVASTLIRKPDSLMKWILEGAGTTLFKRFCAKIVFRRKNQSDTTRAS
jgi:uncharacterized protein (DUF4213/DUF364 family)